MLLNIFGSKLLSFWLNLDYILDKKYPPTPAPSEKKQLILAFSGGSGVMRKKARQERKFLSNDLRTIKSKCLTWTLKKIVIRYLKWDYILIWEISYGH